MDLIAPYNDNIRKIGLIRQHAQENPKAFLDEALNETSMQVKFDQSNEELLEDSKNNGYTVPESPSVNLQDLDEITKTALSDFNESINPSLVGDLEYDNSTRMKSNGFFKSRCKNYAEIICGIIDNMVIIEEYDISMFRNYKELAKLVQNTEGKESAMYLRRLISVARMGIPVMSKYIETSVIDAGITSKSNISEFGAK